jgi:hypothetical protein
MARKKVTIEDLEDNVIDYNDYNVKKLKDDLEEVKFQPSVKMAMRIGKNKIEKVESLNLDNLEAKLNMIAKEKQKVEKSVEKAEKKEDSLKFKKAKKKKKKQKEQQIRLMFSGTQDSMETDSEEDSEPIVVVKNNVVKNTEGTILDNNIGKRFGHLYAKQIDDYEYISKIVDEIKEDLSVSQSKNMYRTSQVSNLLSALGQKRTLLKDMTDMAKTISDLELKYAKEERTNKEESGNDDGLASKIGVSIVRGLYDDVFEENIKKKKKSSKKRKEDDDDDDEDDMDVSSKKDASRRLAERIAKNVVFSNYERNIDIEGEYKICVIADKDEPKDDWKFIIVDEDGERRKDWEKERPELIPNKKEAKMKFLVDKLKASDTRTGKSYKLILK